MGLFSNWWDSFRDFFTGGPSTTDMGVGQGNRLYVGNLSYKVTEDELRSLFSKHGRVRSLHLIRDKFTRRLKGYAFVEMSPDDARKALVLNNNDFLGRKLVVSIAKTRQQGGPSSGGPRRPSGQRWRKRRNGPRAYGQATDSPPMQRLE